MKLSFSTQDKFGNGYGVITPLLPTATPKQIIAIGKYYEEIGWQPSRRTKQAIEAAKVSIKLVRSARLPRK